MYKKFSPIRFPFSKEKGLSTEQLESALEQLMNRTNVREYFVIAADQMKDLKITKYPAVVIQNVDLITQPGSHWISYFFVSAKEVEYFDSYGKHLYIYDFVEKPDARITFQNTRVLQGWFSSLCGEFCLYFLYHRAIGLSFDHVLSSFKAWTHQNERMVHRFYVQHVNQMCQNSKNGQTCCTRNVNKLY